MNPYEDLIIDHWRHPRNKGTLTGPDVDVTEANIPDGDVVRLQLKVRDGRAENVRFDGRGCAISMLSASLLTEMIKGKKFEELRDIREQKLLKALGGVLKRPCQKEGGSFQGNSLGWGSWYRAAFSFG